MNKRAIVLTTGGFGVALTKSQLELANRLAGPEYEIVSAEEFPCVEALFENVSDEHLEQLLEQYDGVAFMDISEQPETYDFDYKQPKQSAPFWANDWRKKHKRR